MGFSVLWGYLHEDGIESTADVLALVGVAQTRGWVRTLCWQDLDEGYREASEADRNSFLDAYSNLAPGWDPDVDYGNPNLHVEITEEGKSEWRRRHPLERDESWKAEHDPKVTTTIWALDEQLADVTLREMLRRGARSLGAARQWSLVNRVVEPATFELRRGEVIDGVKVTYRWVNPDSTTPGS
jgi:hypothetical protein